MRCRTLHSDLIVGKISFNIINRKTGNRVERQYLDSETGDKVERDQQVKGYELENGDHIVIEGDELSELMPDGNKVIRVKNFSNAMKSTSSISTNPIISRLRPTRTAKRFHSWRRRCGSVRSQLLQKLSSFVATECC